MITVTVTNKPIWKLRDMIMSQFEQMNEAANRIYGAKVHVHFGFSTKTVASLPNKTRIEYLWSLTKIVL